MTTATRSVTIPSDSVETFHSIPIEEVINTNKLKIQEIISNRYAPDDSLLLGTLSFAQSKFSSYVLGEFSYELEKMDELNKGNLVDLAQTTKLSPGKVVDRVWIEIHHPTIKYFQSQFHYLSKDSKKKSNKQPKPFPRSSNINTIEIRKLFDSFVKFISKCYEFYFSLVKEIIATYQLSIYIPVKKLTSTLKIDNLPEISRKHVPVEGPIASIVYVINKCILYIGDLSRYRTLIAKTYLPSTSISKEDNNNYSKSIELYKLSLLILPSLGDPYNHVAIIDNLKEDKFNVVYNFIRSSLSSKPLPIGFNNLITFLSKQPESSPLLKRFELFYGTDRSTITKNDRLELLKSEFLILFNYYLLPNKWKLRDGYSINNHNIKDIEDDFYQVSSKLDFHKQIFNDFYFKQLIILLGGFELLIDKKMVHPDLKQQNSIISNYLKFTFRYLDNFMKNVLNNWGTDLKNPRLSTLLLPLLRIMLCWFKERELPRGYLIQTAPYASSLAEILNNIFEYFRLNPDSLEEVDGIEYNKITLFNEKPTRKRLFKEDVTLKEFRPLNYHLNDFNDDSLYQKDEISVLALIGELPNESQKNTKISDSVLRIAAIGYLGKKILIANKVGIKFNSESNMFEIPERKQPPPKPVVEKKRSKEPLKNVKVKSEKPRNMQNKATQKHGLKQQQQQQQQQQNGSSGDVNSTSLRFSKGSSTEPEFNSYANMVDSVVGDDSSNVQFNSLASHMKSVESASTTPSTTGSPFQHQPGFPTNSIWSNNHLSASSTSLPASVDNASTINSSSAVLAAAGAATTPAQQPPSQQYSNNYMQPFQQQQNLMNYYNPSSLNQHQRLDQIFNSSTPAAQSFPNSMFGASQSLPAVNDQQSMFGLLDQSTFQNSSNNILPNLYNSPQLASSSSSSAYLPQQSQSSFPTTASNMGLYNNQSMLTSEHSNLSSASQQEQQLLLLLQQQQQQQQQQRKSDAYSQYTNGGLF